MFTLSTIYRFHASHTSNVQLLQNLCISRKIYAWVNISRDINIQSQSLKLQRQTMFLDNHRGSWTTTEWKHCLTLSSPKWMICFSDYLLHFFLIVWSNFYIQGPVTRFPSPPLPPMCRKCSLPFLYTAFRCPLVSSHLSGIPLYKFSI